MAKFAKYLKFAKFGVALVGAALAAADVAVSGGGGWTQVGIAVVTAVAVFFTKNKV